MLPKPQVKGAGSKLLIINNWIPIQITDLEDINIFKNLLERKAENPHIPKEVIFL